MTSQTGDRGVIDWKPSGPTKIKLGSHSPSIDHTMTARQIAKQVRPNHWAVATAASSLPESATAKIKKEKLT